MATVTPITTRGEAFKRVMTNLLEADPDTDPDHPLCKYFDKCKIRSVKDILDIPTRNYAKAWEYQDGRDTVEVPMTDKNLVLASDAAR